ncbi:MAG: hypothetical protein LBF54_01880 [Holosporaceae bacterium]|jgi:hypothetical protein|nr:hypothetical protein [Holosporaceae bacterium]
MKKLVLMFGILCVICIDRVESMGSMETVLRPFPRAILVRIIEARGTAVPRQEKRNKQDLIRFCERNWSDFPNGVPQNFELTVAAGLMYPTWADFQEVKRTDEWTSFATRFQSLPESQKADTLAGLAYNAKRRTARVLGSLRSQPADEEPTVDAAPAVAIAQPPQPGFQAPPDDYAAEQDWLDLAGQESYDQDKNWLGDAGDAANPEADPWGPIFPYS